MFFKKKKYDRDAPKIGRIESFEFIKLHLSGMRLTEDIEITPQGEEALICSYKYVYRPGGHDRELDISAIRPVGEVLDVLNTCEIGNWSGFHGPHPPHVLDGTMFSFEAAVNGGAKLRADGSENFPPKYREFTNYLFERLREAEKRKGNE